MFLHLKKGDKVIYLSNMPYKLSNGQEVEKEGEEMFINNDITVQSEFFKKIEPAQSPAKEPKEVNVDESKKETTKATNKTKK